jgi:hypothetical protein
MISFFASILAIAVLGFLVFRRGAEQRVKGIGRLRWLLVAALIPLALQVVVFLLFGIGEMASGDLSGAGHLLPAVAGVILAFLTWKRPLEGGAALLIVGVVSLAGLREAAAILILAAPQIISGSLFLAGGMIARKAASSEPG